MRIWQKWKINKRTCLLSGTPCSSHMIFSTWWSNPSYALHISNLSVSKRTRMNVLPTSWRRSVVASPKAQSTPGDGGIMTGKARSSFPKAFAWRGPAPPNATRLKSLGSYPCSTETRRSAPYLQNISFTNIRFDRPALVQLTWFRSRPSVLPLLLRRDPRRGHLPLSGLLLLQPPCQAQTFHLRDTLGGSLIQHLRPSQLQ